MKIGFIYKLKGFFSFSRSDVINVRADVWRGRAVSGKSPHRFWTKVVLDEWAAIPLDLWRVAGELFENNQSPTR